MTEAIRMQARCAVEAERIIEARRKQDELHIRSLQVELQNLQRLQEQFTEQDRRLYEDFVDGKLKREAYFTKKTALRQCLEEIPVKVQSVNQCISTLKSGYSGFIDIYSKYTELDKLTDEIAADLLDRVTIWPDGRLDISLNYLDEYPNIQF